MKKLLLAGAAALSLVGAAHAQSYLIGGVGFEQLINDGFTYNADFSSTFGSVGGLYSDMTAQGDSSATFPAPYVSRVSAYWNGTNFSSTWNGEDGQVSAGSIGGFGNTSSTGEAINTSRRTNTSDTLYGKGLDTEGIYQFANPDTMTDRALGLNLQNGNRLSFVVDSTGIGLDSVKFSAFMQTGASATINWGYSLDGVNLVSTGFSSTISGAIPSIYSVDFSSLSSTLFGDSNLMIVGTFAATSGDTLVLDNAQFVGVIPEPSTYAAVLGAATLGFVILRRRKQAAA